MLFYRIKSVTKALYYRLLCRNSIMNKLAPKGKISVVICLVHGDLLKTGYRGWLKRKAKIEGLDCVTFKRSNGTVEAIIMGEPKKIDMFIKKVWKGPKKAKVYKVTTTWFNKPISKHSNTSSECYQPSNDQMLMYKETENIIRNNLAQFKDILQVPNVFEDVPTISNTTEINRAAKEKGLEVLTDSSLSYIESESKVLGFQQSQSSRVSSAIRSLTDNKQTTKEYLNSYGLPVPKGEMFRKIENAKKYLSKCDHLLVVKPLEGSYGEGITVGVKGEKELELAWSLAKKYHDDIILEELITGIDIRILVIGGVAEVALSRVPANVLGDGQKDIEKLVEEKNRARLKNPRLSKAPIIVDTSTERYLNYRGYNLSSIPKEGEFIFLNLKGNIGSGADSINITDYIHKDLLKLAEEAVQALGVKDFWGVDLLVERVDLPRDNQKCSIIEVNSRANIFNVQFPMYGKPYDAARKLIDHTFKYTDQRSIDKEKMMISQINSFQGGKITAEKLFRRELEKQGYKVWFINDELIKVSKKDRTGYTGIRFSSLFCDKLCQEIFLARKILSKRGIPIPKSKRFKDKEFKEALDYYNLFKDGCVLTSIHLHGNRKIKAKTMTEFKIFWLEEEKRGTKYFILEESLYCDEVSVAVVNQCPVAALLIKGDNKSINVNDILHQNFFEQATRAVEAIPGLELAIVNMSIPDIKSSPEVQKWVVTSIDPSPDVTKFHYPDKGEPFNLVGCIVESLIVNRISWIKGEKMD